MARVTEFDAEVGKRLRHQRRQAGLSQGELGRSLGISFQQIQKYESGRNRFPIENLVKCARLWNLPIEAMLPIEPIKVLEIEESCRQLLTLLAELDQRPRKELVRLLRELIDSVKVKQ